MLKIERDKRYDKRSLGGWSERSCYYRAESLAWAPEITTSTHLQRIFGPYIHHPAVYYSRDPFKRFSLFLSPKFLSTRNFIIPRWCRDVPLCVKMKGIALISEQRRKKTKFNFGRYSKVVWKGERGWKTGLIRLEAEIAWKQEIESIRVGN